MTQRAGILNQLVERASGIYSLPAVAMQVIELTDHPSVDVDALRACIQNDPAMTSKILRVVNSSLFGLSRRVSDLGQALALLGTKPLKMLVLGFSLPKNLFEGIERDVLSRYWRHSLIKAVAARELAEHYSDESGDDAFIVGLLQDIGMLALIQELGDSYIHFLSHVFADGSDLHALEMQTIGFDHAIFSARLLDHWRLHETIVRAIAIPQVPEKIAQLPKQQRPLAEILFLSERIAQVLTQNRRESLTELLEAGELFRGLRIEQFESLIAELSDKIGELSDVLSLDLQNDIDYCQVLAKAHEQLAPLAEEALLGKRDNSPSCEELMSATRKLQATTSETANNQISADSKCSTNQRATSTPRGSIAVASIIERDGQMGRDNSDPGVTGRINEAVNSCRQSRSPLSLLLLEIDRFEDLVMRDSLNGAQQHNTTVELAIMAACDPGDLRLFCGDGRTIVILEDCDREQAVEIARQLIDHVRRSSGITVSAGLATLSLPTPNYPSQELMEAAERCLNATKSSGGDGMKSIDIF